MITEDYVSFETAKLMKEKGFDDRDVLPNFGFNIYEPIHGRLIYNNPSGSIKAPTLQMAMKWLREVHNIDVWVERHNSRYKGCIHSEQRGDEALFYEDSPEEACEAAIKHSLENLI